LKLGLYLVKQKLEERFIFTVCKTFTVSQYVIDIYRKSNWQLVINKDESSRIQIEEELKYLH